MLFLCITTRFKSHQNGLSCGFRFNTAKPSLYITPRFRSIQLRVHLGCKHSSETQGLRNEKHLLIHHPAYIHNTPSFQAKKYLFCCDSLQILSLLPVHCLQGLKHNNSRLFYNAERE